MCGGWFGDNVLEPVGLGHGLADAPVFSEIGDVAKSVGDVAGDVLSNQYVQAALPAVVGFALGGPLGSALGMNALGAGALLGAGTGAITNYKNRGMGAAFGALGGAGGAYGAESLLGAGGTMNLGSTAATPALETAATTGATQAQTAMSAMPNLSTSATLAEGSTIPQGLTSVAGQYAPVADSAGTLLGSSAPGVAAGGNTAADILAGTQPLGSVGSSTINATPGDTGMLGGLMNMLGFGGGTAAGGGGSNSMLPLLMASSQLGGGLAGYTQAQNYQNLAQQADPWAQYRAQYAQQLNSLMQNPSQIQSIPGYLAGLQAVQRSLAAQGYQGSGNMMAALQNYGGNFYQQQLQNLSSLAGTGNANLGANLAATGVQGQTSGINSMLGSLPTYLMLSRLGY